MAKAKNNPDDPLVQVSFRLPQSLVTKLDLLSYDPVRGQIKYGSRAQLFQKLAVEHLERVGANDEDKSEISDGYC